MELNVILKLLDAGYTKADIEAMAAPAAEVTPAPVEDPVKPAEPAEEPAPEMTSADILNNLLAEVKGLKAQIQANNIRSDSMKGIGASKPIETAEDILASVINPKERR